MNRIFVLTTFAVTCVLGTWTSALAQCDACDNGCDACYSNKICVGKSDIVDVEKHCWNVECKEICVPRVRFPWECGGNKLTLFSWCHRGRGCGKTGCTAAGCDGNCDDGCNDGTCGNCVTCVPPKCGFVKTIRDLKKETYKCKECEYSLELIDAPCGHCGCDDHLAKRPSGPTSAFAASQPASRTPQPRLLQPTALPSQAVPTPPEPHAGGNTAKRTSRLGLLEAAFSRVLK